jgi:hypothetical protein
MSDAALRRVERSGRRPLGATIFFDGALLGAE